MRLESTDLLPGEQHVVSKAANVIVKLEDYALQRLPNDQLLRVIGFAGKEAVGGKLHLTNYRLLFKSHSMNRVAGAFSIFLPTVRDLRDTSRFLARKFEVVTLLQRFEFVLWGVPAFLERVREQAARISPEQQRELASLAATDDRLGSGLKPDERAFSNAVNALTEALEIVQSPLQASNILSIIEIIEFLADDEA